MKCLCLITGKRLICLVAVIKCISKVTLYIKNSFSFINYGNLSTKGILQTVLNFINYNVYIMTAVLMPPNVMSKNRHAD